MPLPAFNDDGDLPIGVHRTTLSSVLDRFGEGTAQRRIVANRLIKIYRLAVSTSQVARFIVFGSFVTDKAEPDDVDIFLLMEDSFDLAGVKDEASLVFQHMKADTYLGASIFWITRRGLLVDEQEMVESWQVRRQGGRRGIVEIIPEVI